MRRESRGVGNRTLSGVRLQEVQVTRGFAVWTCRHERSAGADYLSCRVSSHTEGDRQLCKYRWWYLAAAAGSQGASASSSWGWCEPDPAAVEARLNPLLSKLRRT